MKIGLLDVDSHNFPNLPLMKISAYHKSKGDEIEFVFPLKRYDRIYVSKTFGEEYSRLTQFCLQADEIIYGGTGFAIKVIDGKEVYVPSDDAPLPSEIEHIYPDYSLYPQFTENTAFGFLTRGCPNNCPFCLVSKKEGRQSKRVARLEEFWRGQKNIKLLDANILACKDRIKLIDELAESGAWVDFTQGIDARFITDEVAEHLKRVKIKTVHFALDLMENADAVVKGLQTYKNICGGDDKKCIVYMLTNFNTTIEQDLWRVEKIKEIGFAPDVRIYRKPSSPKVLRDLQGWCNNRIIYKSCEFMDYVPRADGKTIRELYFTRSCDEQTRNNQENYGGA